MIRIPENTSIIGELHSSGEIRIDGRFQGDGFVDGTLILTNTSVWIGNAVADTVVVEGNFEGSIIARQKFIAGPQAKILGNIKAPSIKISYGAKLHCELDMKSPKTAVELLEHKPKHEKPIKNELAHIKNEKLNVEKPEDEKPKNTKHKNKNLLKKSSVSPPIKNQQNSHQ